MKAETQERVGKAVGFIWLVGWAGCLAAWGLLCSGWLRWLRWFG